MKTRVNGILLAGVAAAALSAGNAWAAPPPSAWTGFYFGANGGGAWSSGATTVMDNIYGYWPTANLGGISGSGALGGVQAGFDSQFGNTAVFGGVIDFDAASISGDRWFGGKSGYGGSLPFFGGKGDQKVASHYSYLATARLRGGVTMGNFLLFGTGGLAVAGIDNSYTNANFSSTNVSKSGARFGWVAGFGGEYMVSPTTSVQVQYLHADFGSQTLPLSTNYPLYGGAITFNNVLDIVTAGINVRFP